MEDNRDAFVQELKSLLSRHGYHLQGTVRLLSGDRWDASTASLAVYRDVWHGGVHDGTGPFLVGHVEEKAREAAECGLGFRGYVQSDIKGYDCPVTGRRVDGRREHRENLKRTGCRNLEPGESREAQKRTDRALAEHTARASREMVMAAVKQLDL